MTEPMNPANAFIALGALGCLLGVATGAFGAHALEQIVSPDRLGSPMNPDDMVNLDYQAPETNENPVYF